LRVRVFVAARTQNASRPHPDRIKPTSVQGYLAHTKTPIHLGTPKDPRHRLRQDPRRIRFPMSDVPL